MSFIANMINLNENETNKDKIEDILKANNINNIDISDNLDNNNNSNNQIKRRQSSHSSIICIDKDQNKNINNTESNKVTEENIFKDSNIVSSLKNKIKELNNELNKLRNDSNVQNYNILEMNYKLKNKEINELKQENNFFRFNLEEQKRNMGTQRLKKNKLSPNKTKSNIINSVKKYRLRNLLQPMKHKNENNNNNDINYNQEENGKDEIIYNLKFENEKLRKIAKENYKLKEKIDELNILIKEKEGKIEEISNDKIKYKNLYNNIKLKNDLLYNNMNELNKKIDAINNEKSLLEKKLSISPQHMYHPSAEKENQEKIENLEKIIKEKETIANKLTKEYNDNLLYIYKINKINFGKKIFIK